jgi:hypothetical protein
VLLSRVGGQPPVTAVCFRSWDQTAARGAGGLLTHILWTRRRH